MKVAIVGGGISGLAAARTLKARGAEAILFEKSRGVGGRVATRRQSGFTWDTGATSIAPRTKRIRQVMLEELDTTDLVPVDKPIDLHDALRVTGGDPRRSMERFTYRSGNNTLAKLLAAGLDVRLQTQVEEIKPDGARFIVENEGFDAVILTPPVPQTAALLWSLNESRALANAVYRPCLSINLGFSAPNPAVRYHAILSTNPRHPLTWLSIESAKSPDRTPGGGSAFGAQMSPGFSLDNWRKPDEELVEVVCGFLVRLYGPSFASPVASTIMRWKYSQPIGLANFNEVNPEGCRVVIASDGLLGGRVEDAYEVGVMAAEHLLMRP